MAEKCPYCGSSDTEYVSIGTGKIVKGAAIVGGFIADMAIGAGKAALGINVHTKGACKTAVTTPSEKFDLGLGHYECNRCGKNFDK